MAAEFESYVESMKTLLACKHGFGNHTIMQKWKQACAT